MKLEDDGENSSMGLRQGPPIAGEMWEGGRSVATRKGGNYFTAWKRDGGYERGTAPPLHSCWRAPSNICEASGISAKSH